MKRRDRKQWERRFIEEKVEGNHRERKKLWISKGERGKEERKDKNHGKVKERDGKKREKIEIMEKKER